MNIFIKSLFLILMLSGIAASQPVVAQQNDSLFAGNLLPEVASEHAVVASSGRINVALIARGAEFIEIALPDGNTVPVWLLDHERRGRGNFTWRGTTEEGSDEINVTLTLQRGFVAANINLDGVAYEILPKPDAGQVHTIEKLDSSNFLQIERGASDAEPIPADAAEHPGSDSGAAGEDSSSASAEDLASDEMHVLTVYSPQALSAAGGTAQIEATIQAAIDIGNTGFINSNMDARWVLVHAALVNRNDTGDSGTDLSWVRTDPTVAALRNQYGADLVSLVVETLNGSCGRGYVLSNQSGSPDYAHQVSDRGCAVGNSTFAHELGHNIGFSHNPENTQANGFYDDAHGHYVDGVFRTIMSYSNPCTSGCSRVSKFSDPGISEQGYATGILSQRDNARAGRVSASVVAGYRAAVGGGGNTVNVQVSGSSEDVEERASDGVLDMASSDIELGNDPAFNGDQTEGLRFTGINIPQGTTITQAYLVFTVDDIGTSTTVVDIHAEDSDNAAAFTATVNNVTNRPLTTSKTTWNIPSWNTIGQTYNSPDLSAVVQEVVDRQGWSSGNSMAFVIFGTGTRESESYDGSPGGAARLYVEYDGGPPSSGGIRFAAIGDYGSNDSDFDERDVADMVKSKSPDFVITMGDNRYGSNTMDQAVGQFYCQFLAGAGSGAYCNGNQASTNAFFPSLGNHDYDDGGGLSEYLSYFTLPGAGVQSSNTSGTERYYDFIEGPVHFFSIDSDEALASSSDMNAQKAWLQAQLASSTSPWQVVFFHHAAYSSSSNHGSSTGMQWPFAAWGADAVFGAHDHTYERLQIDGIPHFVNGLGGRSRYNCGTPISGSQICYRDDYGAMIMDANDTSMTFEFFTQAGTLIDSHTIQGGPPLPPTPQTPYYGTPQAIPGQIEAEDFDLGSEGEAYHDSDAINSGGEYRPSSGVDIESSTEGGYNVGYLRSGEWLEYTVDVQSAGTYTVQARVASESTGGSFHIEFDGVDESGNISVPVTGGWQTWVTVTATVNLSAGVQEMRFANANSTDAFNISYFNFTPAGGNIPPVAGFTHSTSNLTANFTDTSSDSDGTVVSRSWNFGDGNTSTAQNPSHNYAAAGTYTVGLTVTDDEGASDSDSQSVTVTSAPPTGGGLMGLWEFDNASNLLAATIGNDLSLVGSHASMTGVNGGDGATNIGVGSHYVVNHGMSANGGGTGVNEWTLLIDFKYPSANWISFFQTDPGNVSDGDAFVSPGDGSLGVTATGYSGNTTSTNSWYRMVVSVDNGNFYRIYVNGSLWLEGILQPVDGRFGMASTLLLFADENGEDNEIHVSTAALWDVPLNASEISGLGLAGDPVTVGPPGSFEATAFVPNGAVGHEIQILVKAQDSNGNFLTSGGDTVTGTVSGVNPGTLSFVDNADGTYLAGYTPSSMGTDSVSIFFNGTQLASSPFSSWVNNGFQLKVMTLNVKRSDLYEWDQWRLAETVNAIVESGADIVGLQEVMSAGDISDIAGGVGFSYYDYSSGIISRYPIVDDSPVFGVQIETSPGEFVWVYNTHWPLESDWNVYYLPYAALSGSYTEQQLIDNARVNWDENAGTSSTWNTLQNVSADMALELANGDPVFLVGDFNEPSHLDWSQAAADAGVVPMKVNAPLSNEMNALGLTDSFRVVRPDEVNDVGHTWTPESDIIHDRIDMVYFNDADISSANSLVVGEDATKAEFINSPWPSDHRGVVSTFVIGGDAPPTVQKKLIGYFPEWRNSFKDTIEYSKFSHINYFHIWPNSNGSLDTSGTNLSNLASVRDNAHAAGATISISIGGAGVSDGFPAMANSASARATFITNIVNFVQDNGLDGADLDWEPVDTEQKKDDYSTLIEELRAALPSDKLLTVAVNAERVELRSWAIDDLNWVGVMAYDMNWSNAEHSTFADMVTAIGRYSGIGVPNNKMVVGVPYYGRNNGWTSFVNYVDLVAQCAPLPSENYCNSHFFNGPDLMGNKAQHIVDNDYAGMMVWEITADTFPGGTTTSLTTVLSDILASGGVTPNQDPTAGFTHSCTDLDCSFTDTSSDSDGTIASWLWDFGDGNTSTAQNPGHSYASGGTYNVSLTVTDDDGDSDTANQSVTVVAPDTTPPSITAPADTGAEATGVTTPVSLGTPTVSDDTDPSPSVSNDAPAEFPVGATVVTWTATDASGNSASDTQTVTVTDTTAPSITAPGDVAVESAVPVAVSLGTPSVSDLADPAPSVSNDAPALFPLGTTVVTWTATDASSNFGTDTQTVTVTVPNAAPTADAGPDQNVPDSDGQAGEPVTLDGSGSSDSDGSIVSYAWAWNGGSASGVNPTVNLPDGTTVVTLTVTDDDGATGNDVASITVEAPPPPPYLDQYSTASSTQEGSVSGSHTNTHGDDGSVQSITEQESGGKPSNRRSSLQHQWTFNVSAGTAMSLMANAWISGPVDVDEYIFSYSTDGSNFTDLFTVSSTAGGNMQTAALPASLNGTVYVRVVDSDNSQGERVLGELSVDYLVIRTDNQPVTPPAAPSGLTANAVAHSQVDLGWVDNASDETAYEVERSDGGAGSWSQVATLGTDATSYSDSSVSGDSTYDYRVLAIKGATPSAPSNVASVTTPPAPVSSIELSAQARTQGKRSFADLSWSGAVGSNVLIKRDGSTIATTANDGAYSDNLGKNASGSYTYEVCETDDSACSDPVTVNF